MFPIHRKVIRMLRTNALPLAILVVPALLLAACSGPTRRTARLLDQRVHTRMADDVAANRAALQTVRDGVRVTLLTPSLFPNSLRATDDKYPDIRASVIEGMLDPALMRVNVADTSALPEDQRAARVHNVEQYFAANGLGKVIVPADAAPAGLTITIRVACPPAHGGWGYGTGQADPACF